MHADERKFSLLAFRETRGTARERLHAADDFAAGAIRPGGEPQTAFDRIVEEVRAFLAGLGGNDARDKWLHHEMLNKAVLGFPEERKQLLALINDFLMKKRLHGSGLQDNRYESLAEAVFSEVIGMNVLELVLKEKDGLEEVQVIGRDIFEVRDGVPRRSAFSFKSNADVERLQQNLVLFNQDTLNVRKRWAEVRLSDGSRVTLTGFGFTAEPTVTIRFYTAGKFGLDALAGPEFLTVDATGVLLLKALVHSYINLVVIGATNTGKTHLIKALIAEMPDHERIVTIESRFELMLKRDFPEKNVIEYEISEDDPRHDGQQAFKLALRQSPRRICHAEIRDEDANLYVRACTRGHAGSLTSVHVHHMEDAPSAIADMCMQDGRAVSAERLLKRITMFVTQIGIEMALVGNRRKIVRIGEFSFERGEPAVRTLMRYDRAADRWVYPEKLSDRLAERIAHHVPDLFAALIEAGLVRRC